MTNGKCEALLPNIDSDIAVAIAREFFKQNFAHFDIAETVLQNGTWLVKGRVTSFGIQSNRLLTIDSKTGGIVSCE
jgi:hypothetical protein